MNKPAPPLYIKGMNTDAVALDEPTVLFKARAGDRTAFGALVEAYQHKAYGIAYSFVGNREDAVELAQESFVRAFRAIGRFDTRLPFYPWLYRIIRNTCLNHLKKKKRHGELSLDALIDAGYDVPDHEGTERTVELNELRRAIAGAIGQLQPEHREILLLRHLQELSYSEIAACLEIPQGTVMSRLHAARKGLRKRLEAQETETGGAGGQRSRWGREVSV